MPARDDFGSGAGRPGGYGGGAGGLGNGGIGGGMGGGFGGGGAGRNAGIGSRTGLTTGNVMKGIPGRDGLTFSGRPGSFAQQPGAFGMWGSPSIAQGPLSGVGRPRPAAVPGVNPVPEDIPALEDVPMPPATPNVFNQNYLKNLSDFRTMMNNRYGWGNAMPGPGPVNTPAPSAPPSWRNPTAFPQYSTGWKNQTDNYTQGNTYPGGLNYTREPGRDNTWSNDDTRFGIDSMARSRGY